MLRESQAENEAKEETLATALGSLSQADQASAELKMLLLKKSCALDEATQKEEELKALLHP